MRARPIAILLLLGFTLTLTPYVTVADSTLLEPSYLLEGRFALGVGMTYQYDGSKGTTLAWRRRHFPGVCPIVFRKRLLRWDWFPKPHSAAILLSESSDINKSR